MATLLTHPAHGMKHAYSAGEIAADAANGWTVFEPVAEPLEVAIVEPVDIEPQAIAQPVQYAYQGARRGPKPKAK